MINCFQLKKRLPLLCALIAGQTTVGQAKISITEIMQSNFGGVIDYYNEYPDSWVEIHNTSSEDIDLEGFAIAEKNVLDSAYVIPESFVVPADGYFLIFCDNENMKQHTNFKLNSDKPGALYLWDANGVLQDSLHYPEMISPEVSFGRLTDNPDSLSHFRISTPRSANNNTYTEQVLKKVDFSVDGGLKTEAFYLKLSVKGDCPKNTVIRYTTDGSEPTESSDLFADSIYISKTTVVRAKPFSDSAISKISKTQSYIFDREEKRPPIISISCDNKYLNDGKIGILSDSKYYAEHHPDNPPKYEWMGDENFYYNWRRPINVEFYSGDSLDTGFNQLSETRVSGNTSRHDAYAKSLVIYANKRFGDKHFKGALFKNIKSKVDKQKSMTIRNAGRERYYSISDNVSQTAIGRFAKYYDVDFQAHLSVRLYINGSFVEYMHLLERDNEDFVWANHKESDVECVETGNGLNANWFDKESFPNYANFMDIYQSKKSTYKQMDDVLDISAFMNMLSTQAYFGNVDFPYNNASIWYGKQGTKKWRWILKDMDAAIQDPEYPYYNFILRKDPFEDIEWANNPLACEIFQKMFSLEKFKQPYIDRTCVLSGSVFSHKTMTSLLDSLVNEMSMVMRKSEFRSFANEMESAYEWNKKRQIFYDNDLSQFFHLGDTVRLTINSLQNDSLIYINNNPLVNNKFDGHFFVDRDLYLTHNNKLDIYGLDIPDTDELNYLDLGNLKKTEDSTNTRWTISYIQNETRVYEHYSNDYLHYKIPSGVSDVYITDGYMNDDPLASSPIVTSRVPEDMTYLVYSVGGIFVGRYSYAELLERKQQDDINVVVVLDSMGKKVYSFKLLKSID